MKEFWGLHPTIKIRLVMNFLGALCFSTVGGSMTIYYNKYMGAGITGLLLIVSSIMVFLVGLSCFFQLQKLQLEQHWQLFLTRDFTLILGQPFSDF